MLMYFVLLKIRINFFILQSITCYFGKTSFSVSIFPKTCSSTDWRGENRVMFDPDSQEGGLEERRNTTEA